MPHHNGHPYLEPDEVVRRLQEEFTSCEVDADQGQDDVGARRLEHRYEARLDRIRKARPRFHHGRQSGSEGPMLVAGCTAVSTAGDGANT